MKTKEHVVDLCVIGGGIAGLCAAVSAARHGIKVAIMQDRPVFGGNSSSEIRMWICGAHGENNRETGIVEELFLENYYYNTNQSFSIWDSVLYGKVKSEPNITVLMNCTCQKAKMDNGSICSVTGWQLTTETYHTVTAKIFADCSGDSILAPLTGAPYMLGREAKSQFGESIPPEKADKKTMGLSCLLQPRETDRPQKYIAPPWAYRYETDDAFPFREHNIKDNNFWWIELGGDMDSIHDTEKIKDELLKIAFGVWDHVKNRGDHGAQNWVLDWVGFLPGKRESRRYVGDYIITENDVLAGGKFPDTIAFAGWTMDDHEPAGFHYPKEPNIFHPAPSPWGLPYRSIYSKTIKNLMFAGRNISVTHAALSSSRVMATCGVLGQALGTAAAMAVKGNTDIRDIDIHTLQQTLLEDDCFLPGVARELSPLTRLAKTDHPELVNGIDRPDDTRYNGYIGELNTPVFFSFDAMEKIEEIRIIFDSDLGREYDNMPCCFQLDEPDYKVPKTMIRDFAIRFYDENGTCIKEISVTENYMRLFRCPVGCAASRVEIIPIATYGDTQARIFSVDFH